EAAGMEVRAAADGREAVALFEQFHPHFIWMDIRMPVMDGVEATRRIRELEFGEETVIAAVTAHALEEERQEILAAGCDDFVRKPFREQEIFEAMARHLGLSYVYAGEEAAAASVSRSAAEPTREQLASLPDDLREQLHAAAIRLNAAQTLEVVERVAAVDAAVAAYFRALATDLDFEHMLEFLEVKA
ncbi:MAG: response regulator, partial [Patescibacteria group bacterium]|nr:response regulator [Patescibacteria group bacterium]